MKYTLAAALLSVGIFASLLAPVPSYAATLTEAQIESVIGLLSSFGTDQSVIASIDASLRGESNPAYPTPQCLNLTQDLYPGARDASSNGEVSKLQNFLGTPVTGYFDSVTQAALKSWQVSHGLLYGSYGSEYGFLGRATRAAIAECTPSSYPSPAYAYQPPSYPTYAPIGTSPIYYQTATPSPYGNPFCVLSGGVGTANGQSGYILSWSISNAATAYLTGPMFPTPESIGTYSSTGFTTVTVRGAYTLSVENATGQAATCSATY